MNATQPVVSADHHFVPQFYLSRWTGSDGKLTVYKRVPGRVATDRVHPRSTGFERDLYALEHVGSARQNLERDFFNAQIDTPAADVIAPLVAKPPRVLTGPQRAAFTHFLMSLPARNPDAVNYAKTDGNDLLIKVLDRDPEEYERLRGPDDRAKASEWVAVNRPEVLANFALR